MLLHMSCAPRVDLRCTLSSNYNSPCAPCSLSRGHLVAGAAARQGAHGEDPQRPRSHPQGLVGPAQHAHGMCAEWGRQFVQNLVVTNA
jgi:hypothetical protein